MIAKHLEFTIIIMVHVHHIIKLISYLLGADVEVLIVHAYLLKSSVMHLAPVHDVFADTGDSPSTTTSTK